ncbi:NAD-dependent epimerase/dehydratase family protein [Candidatus Pelagibacter ubique]|nr:NAD-dependent epimerase/dehydratase family protein [Candidatus Pelagibacter ubique]
MKKIFITGGGGYIGTRLVPILLKRKYHVTVFDTFWFGNFLKKDKSLKVIKGDIRDTKKLKKACKKHDVFLHLACISNDSSFELDSRLSKDINFDAFEPMVIAAKEVGIKRFIYASSSSVYGVSKKKNVTEKHSLLPLTLYNKYKGMCEPLLLKHTDRNFVGVIFRPATVCGYSSRLRLDLSVNILTNFGYNKNYIKVFGGDQLRPNLHILDYCDAVLKLINSPDKKVKNQIFNVGNQNMSIMAIAKKVKNILEKRYKRKIEIIKTPSNDKRSYHINSSKIKRLLNFKPKRKIDDAVDEIIKAFQSNKIKNSFENNMYFNVKKLKELKVK